LVVRLRPDIQAAVFKTKHDTDGFGDSFWLGGYFFPPCRALIIPEHGSILEYQTSPGESTLLKCSTSLMPRLIILLAWKFYNFDWAWEL
jgi:hypothetical protein